MSFKLKNTRVMVNQYNVCSLTWLHLEVYLDDMLVRSLLAKDHTAHLQQGFKVLDQHQMKLNPTKCTFGVRSGEFLGYLVT